MSKFKEKSTLLLHFLKQTAKEKNLTDQNLADRSGFDRSNVSRMFAARYMPALDNFLCLCEAVGVRLELHADSPSQTDAKVRSSDTPRFLLVPFEQNSTLFILHTHQPACLIRVNHTTPVTLTVVENYEEYYPDDNLLADAKAFFLNHVAQSDLN